MTSQPKSAGKMVGLWNFDLLCKFKSKLYHVVEIVEFRGIVKRSPTAGLP